MTVSNGKDLQTSLQESVGCQTELSWEHEPMMPGYIEIGCLESSEDIDTDVDSWGAPKGSSSPVAKDAPSALAVCCIDYCTGHFSNRLFCRQSSS
jgi:hypothetical protein